MTRPKDFITREDTATLLDVTPAEVGELIHAKILTVANHSGRIARPLLISQVSAIKKEGQDVREVMLQKLGEAKERTEWKIVIAFSAASIVVLVPVLTWLFG